METKFEVRRRIMLLGAAKSGKTSIIDAAKIEQKRQFKENYIQTTGSDCVTCSARRGDVEIKQTIWDAGGDKKFINIVSCYAKNANACIFVVDSTRPLSDVDEQLKMLESAKAKSPTVKFYFAVTKSDLSSQRHNDFNNQEAAKIQLKKMFLECELTKEPLADDAIFFCSAKTGENIPELFNKITDDFAANLDLTKIPDLAVVKKWVTFEHNRLYDQGYLEWKPPLSTKNKVFLGGNGLLAVAGVTLFVLAAFTVGSFLTFGILPSAFAGAAIITAVALVVWNAVCASYLFASIFASNKPTPRISSEPAPLSPHSSTEKQKQSKLEKTIETNPSPIASNKPTQQTSTEPDPLSPPTLLHKMPTIVKK